MSACRAPPVGGTERCLAEESVLRGLAAEGWGRAGGPQEPLGCEGRHGPCDSGGARRVTLQGRGVREPFQDPVSGRLVGSLSQEGPSGRQTAAPAEGGGPHLLALPTWTWLSPGEMRISSLAEGGAWC